MVEELKLSQSAAQEKQGIKELEAQQNQTNEHLAGLMTSSNSGGM
ncbi:MAG: hypothetical protein ABWX61_07735 [Paenisporosarcina sp.]